MLSSPQFLKQEIMLRVLYSPHAGCGNGCLFFGWCIVSIIAVSMIFAFLTEWCMASLRKGENKLRMFCHCRDICPFSSTDHAFMDSCSWRYYRDLIWERDVWWIRQKCI